MRSPELVKEGTIGGKEDSDEKWLRRPSLYSFVDEQGIAIEVVNILAL